MSRRTRVRQVVLQLLFQDDLNPNPDFDWRRFLFLRLRGKTDLIQLGEKLFQGVKEHRFALDHAVSQAVQNWKLSRMTPVDRNAIRLAIYEFVYFDTPHQVAINEAIELARRFGSNNSPQFVNGILDRVYRNQANIAAPASP